MAGTHWARLSSDLTGFGSWTQFAKPSRCSVSGGLR
jgi:hypothetical protein